MLIATNKPILKQNYSFDDLILAHGFVFLYWDANYAIFSKPDDIYLFHTRGIQ